MQKKRKLGNREIRKWATGLGLICVICGLICLIGGYLWAATSFTFTETFSATTYRAAATTADWNTTAGVLKLLITGTWTATSTASPCPAGRQVHTAVWNTTNNTMIVWGGYISSGVTNTGGIYDPSTNTWTKATSLTNAPAARYMHTAVWTGTKMIVWGGYTTGRVNTGGVYDPAGNSWSATSLTSVPTARTDHTAVWTGTQMIVWGGYDGSYSNSGGVYNPAGAGTWTATQLTGAPTGRYRHKAVSTGTKMIVWDGDNGTNFNTGGVYDPAGAGTWTATLADATAPVSRTGPSAVSTGITMIIWGGDFINTGGVYGAYLSSGIGQSTKVNGALTLDIITATLTAIQTIPANTAITYELTANAGVNWYPVTPTVPFTFPVVGKDLRWRANLSTSNPAQTPLIDQLGIGYVADRVVTTTNWTDLMPVGRNVAMGQTLAYVSFQMNISGTGTAKWKRFRIDKCVTKPGQQLIPDAQIEVQVWVEQNNNGFFDFGDLFLARGNFVNNTCYLNMNRSPVTTASRTYYIVYKLSDDIGGGQTAAVKVENSSYLEFEDATCLGVPP